MTENEQIMEMANDLAKICPDLVDNCCGQVNCVTHLSLSLFKLRYRKVERGEWITPWIMKPYGKAYGTPYCSVCKQLDDEKGDFCRFCGADMRSNKDDKKRKDQLL